MSVDPQRCLVTGAGGYIGRHLCQALAAAGCDVYGTYRRRLAPESTWAGRIDLRSGDDVRRLVEAVQPTVIFHLAYDPRDPQGSIVEATRHLIEARRCLDDPCELMLLSTDAVFDGENSPYTETDRPRPIYPYGEAKAAAERMVLEIGGRVIRTSLVYGFAPMDPRTAGLRRGLVSRSFDYAYFDDEIRCPVWVRDLVGALTILAATPVERQILHVVGSEPLSRYRLACNLAWLMGHDTGRVPKGSRTKSTLVRPRELQLDSRLTRQVLPYRVHGVQEAWHRTRG